MNVHFVPAQDLRSCYIRNFNAVIMHKIPNDPYGGDVVFAEKIKIFSDSGGALLVCHSKRGRI